MGNNPMQIHLSASVLTEGNSTQREFIKDLNKGLLFLYYILIFKYHKIKFMLDKIIILWYTKYIIKEGRAYVYEFTERKHFNLWRND